MTKIADLWPPIIQELREFQKIAEIEGPLFEQLEQAIEDIVNDQFIQTATEKGIARREKILKISPFADDTLETRRFRVQGLWADKLPYTYRVLLERLDSLCGPDGYVIELDAGQYSLNIKIELTRRRMFDEVVRITRQMVPANIVITVELRYNQQFTFANFTHGQLRQYTHYQLRNEVITGGPYKIYGVAIDLTNSNPETAVTYTSDAVGMNPGSAWDSMPIFKDIKPCVLKNGVVQYYLDPNDFTKKADGTPADIESGNDGDVMIEIPKTGFKITTSGNTLTIKVTDNPNDTANFKYYAHTRSTEGDREKLYIGAYLGWNNGGKLRSLSGKTPTANQTIGTFRTQAKANGSGYDLVSFYPLTLLQCLYLIKYKNLDSQTALGRGYVDGNSASIATGGTNAKGMFFGETTGKQQMKFLGIEDMWGNLCWWIDGLFSDANRNILTAFDNFNDTGSGYTSRGQGATSDIGNYMSKPQGSSETGFIAKEVSASATTHFADYADLYASCLPSFGGLWSRASGAGAFYLLVHYSASISYSTLGGRLMYL